MDAADYNRNAIDGGGFPVAAQAELLAAGVAAFQAEHGLAADGKFGPLTRAAWLAAQAPITVPVPPKTKAAWSSLYGDPKFKPAAKARLVVSPQWERDCLVWVAVTPTRSVRMNRAIAGHFEATLAAAVRASGYMPKSAQTFVPRHKMWDTARDPSTHSWGAAVDFDPHDNPCGGVRSDGSPSLMRQHPAFVQTFKDAGWTWGGDWSLKDDMHFQYGTAY
jgi:hypothetical protein